MSIRLERTPLILAILLSAAAAATAFLLPELTYTFILAGLAIIMLAFSLLAGGRNRNADQPLTEQDLVPTQTFGTAPVTAPPSGKLTRAEKKQQKAAAKEAAKAAKERAKFEKEAQAEAAKAEKAAAKEEAKRQKKAAKAEKKGLATEEETDAWLAEIRATNETPPHQPQIPEQPEIVEEAAAATVLADVAQNGPFGPAAEILPDSEATAAPLYETQPDEEPNVPSAAAARDITEEIPIVMTETAPPADITAPSEPVNSHDNTDDTSSQWQYAAYRDDQFTPPFSSEMVRIQTADDPNDPLNSSDPAADSDADDITEADLLDDGLPAEVDLIYKDEEPHSPAARLKSWAERLQGLASDIDHDWDSLMQAYEQRDALLNALEESHKENERLRHELLEKQDVKEIGPLNNALEAARNEVTRLYEDTRELARLRYLNTQTTATLHEIRFALTSQPGEVDAELVALIDKALNPGE